MIIVEIRKGGQDNGVVRNSGHSSGDTGNPDTSPACLVHQRQRHLHGYPGDDEEKGSSPKEREGSPGSMSSGTPLNGFAIMPDHHRGNEIYQACEYFTFRR